MTGQVAFGESGFAQEVEEAGFFDSGEQRGGHQGERFVNDTVDGGEDYQLLVGMPSRGESGRIESLGHYVAVFRSDRGGVV